MGAIDGSRGAVARRQRRGDPRRLPPARRARRACSASPPARPRSPACCATARATPQRVVCVLTGHGLKDPQTALDQAGAVVPVRSRARAGRAGGPGGMRRPPGRPRPGVVGQPRPRLRRVRRGAGAAPRARGRRDGDVRRRDRARHLPRDRPNLVVRGFERLHPPDGFTFRIDSEIPLGGGLGSSAAASVAGLMAADHIFELDADLLARGHRARGPPRQRRRRRCCGGFVVCAGRRGHALRPAGGSRGGARRAPRGRAHARTRAPRCRPRSRWPTRCSTSRHGSLLVLGLAAATGTSSPAGWTTASTSRAARTCSRESLRLVERAQELGALGATISGAGPDGARLDALRADGRRRRGAAPRRAGADVRRVPFEPQGAEVREL